MEFPPKKNACFTQKYSKVNNGVRQCASVQILESASDFLPQVACMQIRRKNTP